MTSFKNKRFLLPILIFLIVYFLFVLGFKQHSQYIAEKQLEKHAKILTDDLWNLNSASVAEYLHLAAESAYYQKVVVTSSNGELFYELTNDKFSILSSIGQRLHLVNNIPLRALIKYNNDEIGTIEVIWIPQNLPVYLITTIVFSLIYLVIFLYQKVLEEKEQLEKRVI